ncbi:hypothetical protein [Streptomyces niveus]|uniref:hypothetical protein n=1 Tax=Streptomyces niveus TaxID=193462 RepID=UPI00366841B1
MNLRTARIQELIEEHADGRKFGEQLHATYRDTLLRKARTESAHGDYTSVSKRWKKVLTDHQDDQKEWAERDALLMEWMKDPLVWVRSSNSDYAAIYHFTKNCGHVQRGNPESFIPRLEGEVKKYRKPCTTERCRTALYVWQHRSHADAA